MRMPPIGPLTPEGEAALEAFLSRPSNPDGTFSLGEVRGFLFAVAAAPDLVKPSEWLPFIFGGGEPEFEDMEEARQVMGVLMSLYNDINDVVHAKGHRWPAGCEFSEDLFANLEPDAAVSQWSRGFSAGHLWLEESWEESLPEELDEEFGAILTTLTFFGSRSVAEGIVKESGKPASMLETFAAKLRDVFPDALVGYAQIGMAIWQALHLAGRGAGGPTAADSRTGRNEPCPCGSGKKYKKCCGAKLH
jgi:uncharacterized protein